MLSFRIGFEPEHKVMINPRHIMYIKPNGPKGAWTWVHLIGGEKLLVDETFADTEQLLHAWEAKYAHD